MAIKKEQTENFVKLIRKDKDVSQLNTYESNNTRNWVYYFDLSGFYKEGYFHIVLACPTKPKRHKTEIVPTTDRKKEIKALLKNNLL